MSTQALEESEGKAPETLSRDMLARFWEIVRPERWQLLQGLFLLLIGAGCRLLLPLLVARIIDSELLPQLAGQVEPGLFQLLGSGLSWLISAYFALAVLEMFARRAQLIVVETAGQNALLDLRTRVFARMTSLPARFYDRTPIGRLVGRVTTDIEALQQIFSSGLVTILGDMIFLGAALALLAALSLRLTIVTVAVLPLIVLITLFVRQRVRQAYAVMRGRLSQMHAWLHEQVAGMALVQLFQREDARRAGFLVINSGVRDAQLTSVSWESVLSASMEMLGSFTTAWILWYGGGLAFDRLEAGTLSSSGITLGVLFAFVDMMRRFFVPLNDLSLKWTVLQNARVSSDRIFKLLAEEPEPPDHPHAQLPQGPCRIEFRAVDFAYAPQTPVLRNLSFTVEPGERIALVGSTGSGKSTILSLLTRLYDVDAGQILLDGIDLRELQRRPLRRCLGVVPQDVFLFRGSILDNLMMGSSTLEEAQALRAASELGLDEIVARFPSGYHEQIAERGKNLSSGEKQLIAFARILASQPRVLLLDEATANIDPRTELLLQKALQRVLESRSALIVAHRLATIEDCDRILVIEKGQIIEEGSHAELMRLGSVYSGLQDLQRGSQPRP